MFVESINKSESDDVYGGNSDDDGDGDGDYDGDYDGNNVLTVSSGTVFCTRQGWNYDASLVMEAEAHTGTVR